MLKLQKNRAVREADRPREQVRPLKINLDRPALERGFAERQKRIRESFPDSINELLLSELVDCEPERGAYTVAFQTTPWMRNPNGVVHGGMLSSMLDNAMGLLLHVLLPDRLLSTVSLEVSFIRPVGVGRTVHARVSLDRVGGTLAHVTSRLYEAGRPDEVLVTAAGVYHLGTRA